MEVDSKKNGGSNILHTYGLLPSYQLQFIVKGNGRIYGQLLLARTRRKVSGIINRRVEDVWWEGGKIADVLNGDSRLKKLLLDILTYEGDIFVDPTDNVVRIYSRFKGENELIIRKESIEAFNIIAGHVKKMMSELE